VVCYSKKAIGVFAKRVPVYWKNNQTGVFTLTRVSTEPAMTLQENYEDFGRDGQGDSLLRRLIGFVAFAAELVPALDRKITVYSRIKCNWSGPVS
jgi:hypothetical protein